MDLSKINIYKHTFNYIISLGSICQVSDILKKNNLKNFSCPFDWILSNNQIILDCLQTNFSILLDKKYYIDNNIEHLDKYKSAGHKKYGDKLFVHHNPRTVEDYEYFTRCVNRFDKVISSDKRKLFVQIIVFPNSNNYNISIIEKNYEKYTEFFKTNFYILFIIISQDSLRSIKLLKEINNNNNGYAIFHVNTISKTNGVKYPDEQDNELLLQLFTNIKYEYVK